MWNYKKMKVWQRADVLSKEIHGLTLLFPKFEKWELGGQMRRSSASVPDNISEGSKKTTEKSFIKFLDDAKGSLAELETQVGRAFEVGYFNEEVERKYLNELNEIDKMLNGVKRYLKKKIWEAEEKRKKEKGLSGKG
ncbi:MAG: four helix bundle protein [Nanoarchaeota archaeon]|nr:four helix bundle protein [Nanoarchaeota archaeon]